MHAPDDSLNAGGLIPPAVLALIPPRFTPPQICSLDRSFGSFKGSSKKVSLGPSLGSFKGSSKQFLERFLKMFLKKIPQKAI